MHKLKEINKALALLDKYDGQLRKTSRELGISYYTLKSWKIKRDKQIPLIKKDKDRKSKRTKEEQSKVIEYYFNHGKSATRAVRKFGYPGRTTLMNWVRKDKRWKRKHKVHKKATLLTDEQKRSAVTDLITRETSAKIVADKYNTNTVSLYLWQKELTGEPIMKKSNSSKQELVNEINELRKEKEKLELENKILKKANEILKKEVGTDYSLLTNKEKTLVVSALKNEVNIKVISGDNPLTVSKIAEASGILNSENYISLDSLSDDEVKEATLKYNVFGRVSPYQKELIVKTLKENDHTVAMVGDGINDILSLKSADVSIALQSGSKATKDIASLVLIDNNFNKLAFFLIFNLLL